MAISTVIFLFLSELLVISQLVQSHCPKEFECGNITMWFPFSTDTRPDCGLHLVQCHNDMEPKIQVLPGGQWYIQRQLEDRILVTPSFDQGKHCTSFSNLTLPNSPAISFETRTVTTLKCSSSETLDMNLNRYKKFSECETDHYFNIYYNYGEGGISDVAGDHPSNCLIIRWPIGENTFDPQVEHQLFDVLDKVFLNWRVPESCTGCQSGKQCVVDHKSYTCSKEPGSGRTKHTVIVTAIVVAASLLASGITIYILRRRKLHYASQVITQYKGPQVKNRDFLLTGVIPSKGDYSIESSTEDYDLPLFDFSTIALSTDHFSYANKLGQGGFGVVYKGVLPDGQVIAAKRLSKNSGQGVKEFKNELKLIARVQHRNLVRLLG